MDDDLAITLGILLAVDEPTARRIAENLGRTFGTTAGKGANQTFNKTVGGGGGEARASGEKKGKEFAKGFSTGVKQIEDITKASLQRATNAAKQADIRTSTIQRQGTTGGQVAVDRLRREQNDIHSLYSTSNQKILADAKRHNAAMIASDQQSAVRRTVYIRTALNNLTRVNQSVMTAILTAWRSHHQRRIADEQSANRKAEIELQGSMDRRLAKIKAGSRQQSLAATANATASERANTALSGGVLGAVTGRGMGVASLFAGALGGREIFNILGEFQSIETAFKGIFREVDGGAPRTTQFLKDMQAFARETPFTLNQVSLAAQKMFAARLVNPEDADATEQLTEKLRRLADAASATGKNASQMDAALLGITQIQGTGFMMEELRQVTENIGLPMDEVAKSLGMSVKEMKDAMKEGSIGVKEGLDAIFDAMTRIPGAAGASARQAKTLRGAMSQLRDVGEQLVIKFLMPVGNAFSAAALAMGKFGDQLISGRGAWKVARDALGGIVGALTAIIAAKGAIQVVKLLGIGLSAIAAAPVTAALVALVGVLSTFDGLRAKLASLVEGTKNWFLVGYRANTVIDSFSGFVKVITTVGKFARTVQDFTKALVVGTKDWFLVGYRISGVIDEFSNIVLFQTSLGAAARVIVDALRGIWDALGALAQTRDFGEFRKALGRIAKDAGKALSPIKDALAEQFGKGVDAAKAAAGKAIKAVVGWVGNNMDSIISGARVASGGALILRMLGLARGGNFLGAAQLGIGVAIAGALIGAARSLAKDQTADEFGKQINEFLQKGIDRAFDAAVIIAAVVGKLGSLVGDVWGALFGGEGGGDAAADPQASISVAAKIAATITAAWKKATENLGNLASAIGTWFTESFTAWIVDFPYEVGRKLSSTIFQDEVFKALGTAAVAAGAAGLFIAGQFVLGFIQGMGDAAPELGGMLKDAFTGALGGDIGTAFAGSILLGMGVVFAGASSPPSPPRSRLRSASSPSGSTRTAPATPASGSPGSSERWTAPGPRPLTSA
ncbi:MAG: tape measure protein [Microthrixaceae bacterium]|nr:tape measure protein [Microthrixaceae bacterium]